MKRESTNEHFLEKALIGGFCSAVVASFLNPLDVTKIRMQNQLKSNGQGVRYPNMFYGIKRILSEEGFLGLCRGIEPSMWREISYSSLRMGGYEPIRQMLTAPGTHPADTSPLIKVLSSLTSGGVGSAICNPLDIVKTRLQATLPGEPIPYRNTWHGFTSIFKSDGFKGLYKGWQVTSLRAAMITAGQLGSYDSIKHNLCMNILGMKDGFFLHFAASMTAGIITTTISNPFDVVKTRFLGDQTGKYSGLVDCTVKLIKNDGLVGFFWGWTPAYWRIGSHTVFALILIEQTRMLLGYSTI